MNGVLNKPQITNNGLWYCDLCEKELNFSSRLRRNKYNAQIHKEKFGIAVKEYEIIETETDEIKYLLDNVIKECRDKFLHTFEYCGVFDFKFINIANYEKNILTITNGCKCFEGEFFGLNKKNQKTPIKRVQIR